MREAAVTSEEQTRSRREAILAEYAEEEAEAAEIEVPRTPQHWTCR